MTRRHRDPSHVEPFAELEERHAHPYTRGHYVGGRIPPYWRRVRPNRFGVASIAFGLMGLGMAAWAAYSASDSGPDADRNAWQWLALFGFGWVAAFLIVSVLRLWRGADRRHRRGGAVLASAVRRDYDAPGP